MQLTYLIKSAEVRDRFISEKLPDGMKRGVVGTYEADGGELYILSFSVNGSTLAGARALSKLRGSLRDAVNARLLVDDVSLKFANSLYPRFAEYERKLRLAITLATCAEHDNFDDSLVKSLEQLTLEGLGRQLFFDTSFQGKVKSKIKDLFTKCEIVDFITGLQEDTVWIQLFREETLPSVRKNYYALCDMRNKVMHHKLITEEAYDRARRMLRASIGELDAYVEKIRSDVSYPKQHAARAASAAKLIRENYESMFQNLGGSSEQFAALAIAAQKAASLIDTSELASIVAQTAGIQEMIDKNRETWASVARVASSLGIAQTPGLTSAIDAIGQQTQLQKLISDEAFANLARPAISIDFPALQANALPNAAMPIFPPSGGISSISADTGYVDEEVPDERLSDEEDTSELDE